MANPNPSPATRYRKGTSGNPKGRPQSIKTKALKILHKARMGRATEAESKLCAAMLLAAAEGGDFDCIRLVLDMVEGPSR